jgi:transcriptional regulator with XRE-family HTH domain
MEDVRHIVAENVKLARERAGISQEELADTAGIDRSYASRIERGVANPSVEVLAKVAGALSVPVASLLAAGDE